MKNIKKIVLKTALVLLGSAMATNADAQHIRILRHAHDGAQALGILVGDADQETRLLAISIVGHERGLAVIMADRRPCIISKDDVAAQHAAMARKRALEQLLRRYGHGRPPRFKTIPRIASAGAFGSL